MRDSRKTILLTGATGNMGREAVKRIAENADALRLRVFVRPEERSLPFVKSVMRGGLAEIHWGDLRDAKSVTEAVRDADIVLHVAALVSPLADRTAPEIVDAVNVSGTHNIVEAIRASGRQDDIRLVYVGSVAQTGGRNPPIHWSPRRRSDQDQPVRPLRPNQDARRSPGGRVRR